MDKMGYGANSPINVSKNSNTFKRVLLFGFFALVIAFLGLFAFLEPKSSLSSSTLDCVYASNYYAPDTWVAKTWNGNLNSFNGDNIWTDGVNYYFNTTSNSVSRVLDISTSTWSTMTWNGNLSSFMGQDVWTDGINIYYDYSGTHRILDVSTHTWSTMTWSGISSTLRGRDVWTDGVNYYYSINANHYILDSSTNTWSYASFNGTWDANGRYVWTDGVNTYVNYGSVSKVFDISTSTWSDMSWFGLTSFNGNNVWSDGVNYYYSSSTAQYVLDVSTHTWSQKTWYGLTDYNGSFVYNIYNLGDNIYYSYATNHYELVKDGSSTPVDIVPSFNAVQYGPDIMLTFDSNLDQLDIYPDMIFNIYIADSSFTTKNLIASFDTVWFDDIISTVDGDYSWTFVCSLPYRYITFEWYYSSSNYYYVDFEYSSFNWGVVDILDIYDSSNLHTDFVASSPFDIYNSPDLIHFFYAFLDFDYYNDFLTFDVYSSLSPDTLFNSFSADTSFVPNSSSTISYLRSVMNDSSFANSVSYRGKFVFADFDFNSSFYSFYNGIMQTLGNGFTLVSGFTFNYYDFFVDLGVDTETVYSSWFYVPYTLDVPVLTKTAYNELSWSNIQGADYYTLYLNDNEYVTNLIGTSYVVDSLGTYYVVANSNLIGVNSSISNTVTLTSSTLDTPVISLTYAHITWEPVDYADYYVLYIYDSSTSSYVLYQSNIYSTGYTLIYTGHYRVRAVSESVFFTDSSLSNDIDFVGAWSPGGSSNSNSLSGLIGAVVDVPVHYIVSMFDFDMDFLGFNMLNLIMSVFTLCVVIFIIKFVLGQLGG